MLRFLSVRQLAVIDAVEIEFERGLNVLTGETGAGKSILVSAVGLLAGGRASGDLVRTGAEIAVVQAAFETPEGRDLIVRREVSAQGRSRAFVNDVLVTTAALKEVAGDLVELHGQHDHQILLNPATHLDLVDRFGELVAARGAVEEAHGEMRRARVALDRVETDDREKAARIDLLSFQLGEIDRVRPAPGEDAQLAATRQRLVNADRLHRLCTESYVALYEGEGAVLGALSGVWRRVRELASLDPAFGTYESLREPVAAQLEDLAFFLRTYASQLDASPERLQEVEDRLAALDRLTRKYGPTLADVLAHRERVTRDLEAYAVSAERAGELRERFEASRDRYAAVARELSSARRLAARQLASRLVVELESLAMPHTRCEVRFEEDPLPEPLWSERGFDQAEFYLSPNPGEDLRPLARIASGGELSRIMLALRTLASAGSPGKTLVFDEVDAGIGGAVADRVGERLAALGAASQVFCITHLPQIAAYGSAQFRIAKRVDRSRTSTSVERLGDAGRVEELARMIAGDDPSDHVRASARSLLEARQRAKGESKPKGESESRGSETAKAKAKGRRGG
jgi:DNA repair protein RecN (Recombination protein N)